MFVQSVVCVLVLSVFAAARPNHDVEIVESTIREVRAVAPNDLLLAETNYGHDGQGADEDSIGYLKRTEDGGKDGYKHFDSYHIKDGDKYGYEKHTAFGKANDYINDGGANEDSDEKGSYKVAEELNEDEEDEQVDSAEKYTDAENVENDGGEGDEGGHYSEGAHSDYDVGESAKYTEADGESEAEDIDY